MEPPLENKTDFRVIFECMTESVLITTPDLDLPGPFIIYINPAFEKMTGWTKEEVIGQNPRLLQGPNTDLGIFQTMRQKLAVEKVWRGRTINYKKDGSEFYMQWSIVPIKDSEGEICQYLAVQSDVSGIVRTEEKLEVAREAERKRIAEIEGKNEELNQLIKKQKRILDLFAKYVPDYIVKGALSNRKSALQVNHQLEVALLFCDIRGFTSIVENLSPTETVNLLNEYYSHMSEVIKQHNGVINQFVGDEIFVSFGAPSPIDEPEISAVRCAKDMINKLQEINQLLASWVSKEIVVGIGINFGPIVAGNLGSEDRLSYSITGDAVNTAKRIESLTQKLPNTILISQSIYDKVQSIVETEPLGEVPIKGKKRKVKVYKVLP
ncbi:MAG: adenylate/guanylate cyclase domain-containing protein [Bacteroidia bacterium]